MKEETSKNGIKLDFNELDQQHHTASKMSSGCEVKYQNINSVFSWIVQCFKAATRKQVLISIWKHAGIYLLDVSFTLTWIFLESSMKWAFMLIQALHLFINVNEPLPHSEGSVCPAGLHLTGLTCRSSAVLTSSPVISSTLWLILSTTGCSCDPSQALGEKDRVTAAV